MAENTALLGEYLLNKGMITRAQLQEAIEEQQRTNRKLRDIFTSRGFVKEEDIAQAISDQLDLVFKDISDYQIDTNVLSLIPMQMILRLEIVPLFKLGDSLTIAAANPLDMDGIDELSRLSGGLRIKLIISTPQAIKAAIEKYYGKQLTETAPKVPGAKLRDTKIETGILIREAASAPVIHLVDQLIEDAVKQGASDIHLEPQDDNLYCRFRIDGILHEKPSMPPESQLAVISRIKVMAEIDIAQNRIPQDGRIRKNIFGRDVDLRIATFPTIYGEHISIRILDKTQGLYKLEELGFHEQVLATINDIIRRPYGIVLVTGPTGSGKSTTIYSILNVINDSKKNIVTLEDPVEYTIPRVNQSQVNVKAGLLFATGLRSILRLDPDIIMIGEIRDRETAEIAVHSSLTGHLVFSTLHTNDAPSAASRLIDIGVEPYLLSSSLLGVLAQRLVRKLCLKCRVESKPSREELALMGGNKGEKFYKPVGCAECQGTGYKGRTGIFEFLVPDEDIKNMILKKAPAYEIRTIAQKSGMRTLREDGLDKVAAGITSLAEVVRVTEEV